MLLFSHIAGAPRILYEYVISQEQPTFTQIGSSYDPQKANNSVIQPKNRRASSEGAKKAEM